MVLWDCMGWGSHVANSFWEGRLKGGRLAMIAIVTRKKGTSISTVPVCGHCLSKQKDGS